MAQRSTSLLIDFKNILFSPKNFFEKRFLELSTKRIFLLGFIGVFLGLVLGSLLTLLFSHMVASDFLLNKEPYMKALHNLGFNEKEFLQLLEIQKTYSILLALLSPLISYMMPHLLGGALFIFLWLFTRSQKISLNFARVMECVAISTTSMLFYVIPALGPLIALVMITINISHALRVHYQITGTMKVVSILLALYVSLILPSASLQLLAQPLATMIK